MHLLGTVTKAIQLGMLPRARHWHSGTQAGMLGEIQVPGAPRSQGGLVLLRTTVTVTMTWNVTVTL